MNTQPTSLASVGRSAARRASASAVIDPASNASYRRLAVYILGLDLATLATELRSSRLQTARTEQRAA